LLDGSNHFSKSWLSQKQWIAVPVKVPMLEPDAEWIANALAYIDISACYALTLDTPEQHVYRLNVAQEELLTFYRQMSDVNVLITSMDLKFAILKAEHYFLVSGHEQFVRQSVGVSLSVAQAVFEDYGRSSFRGGNEDIRNKIKAVYARYRIPPK
jgi:hypothetical protein